MEGTYGHNEGVGESGDGISELMGKLDVMLVQPTTRNDGNSVESSDAGLRKDAREEVSDDTADSVRSEDLDPSKQQESLEQKKARTSRASS